MDPKTLIERLIYWAAMKAGLLSRHTPTMEEITSSIIRLDGEMKDNISKAIVDHMNRSNATPNDLIILMGKEEYSNLARESSFMMTSMEFGKNDRLWRGVQILVVPYINGALVLRRSDLAARP
jgi:hypothetical protein